MNRIAGLETEYGCLTSDQSGPPNVVSRVRNWLFDKHRFGLSDTRQRNGDELGTSGGFLFNGGRAYVDMGHLEYCTPECLSLRDLLRYDRAGDALLLQALRQLKLGEQTGFIRNNIDHYTGATFGCHENYLLRRDAPLNEANVLSLLAFLTLRVLHTGAGRVGSSLGAEFRGDLRQPGADADFQISQRADYINNDLFEWVQFNRAIINTRDEPLGDAHRFRRLHLLHGDTNVLPAALALKVGATALVLDLLEADALPKVALADPVAALRELSHRPDGPWTALLADGSRASVVGLLAQYQASAQAAFGGRDRETDLVLAQWGQTLRQLQANPEALVGEVDWITKRWLFSRFVSREGICWSDAWLKALDLEFHHVDPARSLGLVLERTPPAWRVSRKEVAAALRQPPANTRARVRARLMRLLKEQPARCFVDWDLIDAEGLPPLVLQDPFADAPAEAEAWERQLRDSANNG